MLLPGQFDRGVLVARGCSAQGSRCFATWLPALLCVSALVVLTAVFGAAHRHASSTSSVAPAAAHANTTNDAEVTADAAVYTTAFGSAAMLALGAVVLPGLAKYLCPPRGVLTYDRVRGCNAALAPRTSAATAAAAMLIADALWLPLAVVRHPSVLARSTWLRAVVHAAFFESVGSFGGTCGAGLGASYAVCTAVGVFLACVAPCCAAAPSPAERSASDGPREAWARLVKGQGALRALLLGTVVPVAHKVLSTMPCAPFLDVASGNATAAPSNSTDGSASLAAAASAAMLLCSSAPCGGASHVAFATTSVVLLVIVGPFWYVATTQLRLLDDAADVCSADTRKVDPLGNTLLMLSRGAVLVPFALNIPLLPALGCSLCADLGCFLFLAFHRFSSVGVINFLAVWSAAVRCVTTALVAAFALASSRKLPTDNSLLFSVLGDADMLGLIWGVAMLLLWALLAGVLSWKFRFFYEPWTDDDNGTITVGPIVLY